MLLLPSWIFKIRDHIENLSVVRGRAGGPPSNIRSAISCQPAFLTGFRREVSETPSELRRVPRAGRVAARSSRRIKRGNAP